MTALVLADYDGAPMSFDADGWFNATVAAKKYGKKPGEWLRLEETERYVKALRRRTKAGQAHFARTVRGGAKGAAGTWFHPKLAIRFASWLDADFAVWCDEQIERILRSHQADAPGRLIGDIWQLRLSIEKADSRSFALASQGARWMGERKRLMPRLREQREQLKVDMELTLFPPSDADGLQ